MSKTKDENKGEGKAALLALFLMVIFFLSVFVYAKGKHKNEVYIKSDAASSTETIATTTETIAPPVLDKLAYDKKLALLANNLFAVSSSTATSTSATSTATTTKRTTRWPVRSVYPNAGALLPFNRIIAYYGN